ncbi:MAG: hypothetical protein PHC64_06435 [Candidatus Gastranaerophilales bacterium]|nr:hypothetical protein [Candidatus Gastranaerophilales bacterium]
MNKILIIGKYLDQPMLVGKFSKTVPCLFLAGGATCIFNNVCKAPEEEKHKEFIKSISVLTATICSALFATIGIPPIKADKKVLFKGFEGLSKKNDLKKLVQTNTLVVNDFLQNNKVSKKTGELLEKAKTKILKLSEIKIIFEELHRQKEGKRFLNKLIPDPENVDSKHIFSEIKRLSLIGLVPVLGGITGGIIGDRLTEKNWKDRIQNKLKEGSYQYFANIFLCNIGAGIALAILEKAKITSKPARAIGMLAGILAVGIIGGSAIANLIGKTCIEPILEKKHYNRHQRHQHLQNKVNFSKIETLYSERKPEALDIGLHIDDIATVAVLSGLKWIEPILPVLYSISGYRAGTGYRNGKTKDFYI